jgi:meso-butanediol dehydrogenase/(S,S)-butanediol dehydrogenase/diacetyl reductase
LATKDAWLTVKLRGGVILNTGSIAGTIAGSDGNTAHSVTKAGVIALTKQLAVQGTPFGIRSISISPGAIETPGTVQIFDQPGVRERQAAATLVGMIGRPSDIVNVALFLASEAASFMTGIDVAVDGGRIAASGRKAHKSQYV